MKQIFILLGLIIFVQTEGFTQTIIAAKDLQADFDIVRKSYETLHPGLYKYENKATIDSHFEACKKALDHDQTLQEAYLNFAKLTAKFKCGHSYANFFNQEAFIQKELFENKTALPFHFRLIEDQMLVTKSADLNILAGVEVKTINGIAIKKIIETLLPIVRADGSNDGKRRKLLELTGQRYEYFDIFFPQYFPLKKGDFALETYNFKTKKTTTITVNAMKHGERDSILKQLYPSVKPPKTAFAWQDANTAVMTLNNFSTNNDNFDFEAFFLKCTAEYTEKKGKNLIVDIRNAEGGNDDVGQKLIRHLLEKPITLQDEQVCWSYISIDTALDGYVKNKDWAGSKMYRKSEDFIQLVSGQYREKNKGNPFTLTPHEKHISGNVYLMTSPTNSSATYVFARTIKDNKLATLVGQTTGGNQKGITASSLFFIELPHSKIEVDVPLVGVDYNVAKNRPDAGLMPDVSVKPLIEDVLKDIDTEMEVVKNLILKGGNK
jgi:Peptidase family S41